MKYLNSVPRLLLFIPTSAVCILLSASAQTSTSTNVIERAKAALRTMEGPRQGLIEELGNAGTPECEQLLVDALSFAPPEETAQMPPAWRSMLQGEVRSLAARQLVRLGSARVIPTLRLWLDAGVTNRSTAEHNQQLHVAVTGLAEFCDVDSLPKIETLYQNSTYHSVVQELAADAIATIASRESTNLLCRLLWNEGLRLDTRCKIANALVRQDVEIGRDVLLAFYDLGIARLKADRSGGGGVARASLATLGDSNLIFRLKDRATREPPSTIRNNITTLVDEMTISSLPLDEVVKLAEDTRWSAGMYKRYPAIQRLGRDGTVSHIRVLSSLKPWDTVGTGAYDLQQQMLRDIATESIRQIKKRHWAEFVDQ